MLVPVTKDAVSEGKVPMSARFEQRLGLVQAVLSSVLVCVYCEWPASITLLPATYGTAHAAQRERDSSRNVEAAIAAFPETLS